APPRELSTTRQFGPARDARGSRETLQLISADITVESGQVGFAFHSEPERQRVRCRELKHLVSQSPIEADDTHRDHVTHGMSVADANEGQASGLLRATRRQRILQTRRI